MTKNLINDCKSRCDNLASADLTNPRNVIAAFNEMDRVYSNGSNLLGLLDEVSPHKPIRDACNSAVSELSKFRIEIK